MPILQETWLSQLCYQQAKGQHLTQQTDLSIASIACKRHRKRTRKRKRCFCDMNSQQNMTSIPRHF